MAYSSTLGAIHAGRFKKVAHVFIESGQSNCQGRGVVGESPIADDVLVGDVKTWRRNTNGGDMYSGSGTWYALEYDTNQYEARAEFGSVLKFAMHLRDNLEDANNDIYIIKADGNGKPIAGWLNSGSEATAMYSGHITPALASLVSMKNSGTYDEIHIHGMFWDQGEGDSDTPAEANAYQANLTTLISDVRAAVGIADLPWIIRRTESTHVNHTYVSTVAAAQESIATADSRVEIITGPFTYTGDAVHLNGSAQNIVGDERYTLLTSMTQGSLYNG